jgi:hypothetical protein
MFKFLSLAGAAAAVLLFGSVALAAGNGATTETQHAHGTDVGQIGIIGITPPPDFPADCPVSLPIAFVPTKGNAIQHDTENSTGFWFTSTVTAQVDLFEGTIIDEEDDVAPVGDALYTGHLTTWFGEEDNNQNGVTHSTVNFQGTSLSDGSHLRIHGNFDFTMNANGDITANPINVSCVVS